jgi:predicted metal-dependent TIM-barrel fold hydrolase
MGSNLAIPFWVVGHIHLSLNVYKDIYEILSSCGMNILVLLAFWFEWKKEKKKNPQNN